MRQTRLLLIALAFTVLLAGAAPSGAEFKVGFATRDISPTKPIPMWGYGARHALLSEGVRDPLYAKALVLEAGKDKVAVVGLDIGRGPTEPMMANIRKAIKETSGIAYAMIGGSHTHHGPVIELKDEPGKGQGAFDDAVAYVKALETNIIDAINEAAQNARPAKIGWGSMEVEYNRNRQTKIQPKPVDRELAVVRFDDLAGEPMAILVNFAAHPVNLSIMDRRFSSEYPGQLKGAVEEALGVHCVFMQGAAGDLSCNKGPLKTIEAFGQALADKVVAIATGIETHAPERPSIKAIEEDFAFPARLDLFNPLIQGVFQQAFFPEMIAMLDEFPKNTVRPHLTTVLVNGQLALVGASGEFFCNHAIRLKERSRVEKTLFFGYCNGHQMYFPTIEATAEGGYGCDPSVSWVAIGAGEEMMNKALINIYTLMGKYDRQASLLNMSAPGNQ